MKKYLISVLALGMLVVMVAPVMATDHVFIGNFHWVGVYGHARLSGAGSGGEIINDTDGNVEVTNDDATATAGGVDVVNTDVVDVGGPAADSHHVAVVNASGAGLVLTYSDSVAVSGGDIVNDTDEDVTVENGAAESHAWGFTVTNSSITRVR